MNRNARTGGIGRRTLSLLMAAAVLMVTSCSGGLVESRAVAWSWDPCGLAPPQEVSAAFGTTAAPAASPAEDECRYTVGGTLLRVIVLSDSDTCEGARRSLAALGSTLAAPADAPAGVFVVEPPGDVLVCDPQVTYLLTAAGRSAELLTLVATLPSQRSN